MHGTSSLKRDPLKGVVRIREAKPLLKWAGGKNQLLGELNKHIPSTFGKYIEPFFGGGALYFHLQPKRSIIADSNPELVNLYKTVATSPEKVISFLNKYKNTKSHFLLVRDMNWEELPPAEAAARTIFLNKTCFNGLYRVNKSGKFNVPFGNYKNPNIADEKTIFAAAELLKTATIICGDYKIVLQRFAKKGDFVFLDPPYLPISKYSDFKRYTKEQFYEEDHIELAEEVKRLINIGCHVILTNSNHPLVHKLYDQYEIRVVKTKRYINSKASKRSGEDVIIVAKPGMRVDLNHIAPTLSPQVQHFPSSRFMGSKSKLLDSIWNVASQFEFDTVLDLFSGSGAVSYMFKAQGKQVIANDYMHMASTYSKAFIENNSVRLTNKDIEVLLDRNTKDDRFVQETFGNLYFLDEENKFIDQIRANSKRLRSTKRALAITALIRACIKKRPRGIFTYVGNKYDDGRKDIKMTLEEQFIDAVERINKAIFDNGKDNKALCGDALSINEKADLVYIDPPYFSPFSDNEYVRRYHFVEGLSRDWKGVDIQEHTITKKFKSYPTPFSSQKGARDAFDKLFKKFKKSILLVSYSSNSLPTLDEMIEIMTQYKEHVDVVQIDHQYSFGTHKNKLRNKNNVVKEYLFVGY